MNKIIIKCVIEVKTGLHIGGNDSFSAIGMVDSPVIKDSKTTCPMIPGSSLKGKLRSLLSISKNGGKAVDFNKDGEEILRLFGSSEKNNVKYARLQFSDCFCTDETPDNKYEIKYENTIDRINISANPRQIERVVRGTCFDTLITYNVPENQDEQKMDLTNLIQAMKLLQLDYLGGGGTRGNGRIQFKNFEISVLDENCNIKTDESLTKLFKEVEEYGEMYYKV